MPGWEGQNRPPGYCYNTETGFFYLQSRYYDPTLCRFINADAFTSTGQGFLGYNMFAYCGNGPVIGSDPSGKNFQYLRTEYADAVCIIIYASISGAAISSAACVGAGQCLGANTILQSVVSDSYQYAKHVLGEKMESLSRKLPQVHHIIPWGEFSGRGEYITSQMADMHDVFNKYGVDVKYNPINFIVVSAETHQHLHTNSYITHAWSYVMGASSKEELYLMLFCLRLEIAAMDNFAWGF